MSIHDRRSPVELPTSDEIEADLKSIIAFIDTVQKRKMT